MKLSFILPIYNEEKNIPILYDKLIQVTNKIKIENLSYEMIFINDWSKDWSLIELLKLKDKDKNIKIINFSRNFGHELAVYAWIDLADWDINITMDTDLQDPPAVIEQLVEWVTKGYDIVYAKRRKRDDSFFKNFTAIMYYKIIRKMTNVDIPENTWNFRAFNKKVLEELKKIKVKNRFFRGIVAGLGFKQTFIEFDRPLRVHGETNYTLSKMISLAWDGVTSLSFIPLKLATWLGFIISFFNFIYIAILLIRKYLNPSFALEWWTSTIIIVLFIWWIQLIILWIIWEYIWRIYNEVQNKPVYIIDEIL